MRDEIEYTERIEYINGFKIIHMFPNITDEENETIKINIVRKINKMFE